MILGHSLNGNMYKPIAENSALAGVLYCGPMKFLGAMETCLGLPSFHISAIIRTLAYENMLRKNDTGNQFYSESFKIDPRGTASKLLALRDEIFLSSNSEFRISCLSKASKRLNSLFKIESSAGDFAPGMPDRLRAILKELRMKRIPRPVATITLTEGSKMWPLLWQEVFSELASLGCKFSEYLSPDAASVGDLFLAKQALSGLGQKREKASCDGSLILIEANNPVEAADIAALVARELREQKETVAVVAEHDSATLRAGFSRMDMALPGSEQSSYGLDMLQILPLRLLLAWKPVDPRSLQQYLSLSVSPIPTRLRKSLMEIISRTGCVGGISWDETVSGFIDSMGKEKQLTAKESISAWLKMGYLDSNGKSDPEDIGALCGLLRDWARKRAFSSETDEQGLYMAMEQADVIRKACEMADKDLLHKQYMAKLLRDVMETMPVLQRSIRDLDGAFQVSSAGAMLAKADSLIWWNAGEKTVEALPARFWTKSEDKELEEFGVRLSRPSDNLARNQMEWVRGISCAGKRLILIFSRIHGDESEPDEVHPVWHELTSAFENDSIAGLTVRFNDLVLGKMKNQVAKMIMPHFRKSEHGCFPVYKDKWSLEPSLLKSRESNSASSFLSLAGCPFSYVCRYLGNIRSRETLSISEDDQLNGNISHDIIERFLASCAEWPEQKDIRGAVGEIFRKYLVEEGAILNLSGKEKERSDLEMKIVFACEQLVKILRAGGYEIDGVEKEVERTTDLGPVKGFCDVVVRKRKAKNHKAVIDLKWSGAGYRTNELSEGKAIQLAVYSAVADDSWPPTAYFIISSGEMITVHKDAFPGATVIDGPDEQTTWKKIKSTIDKRKESFSSGTLSVGITDDSGKAPDFVFASCKFCDLKMFCRISESL